MARLQGLFSPKSIAIIGASTNPEKVGYSVTNNLLSIGFRGKIYPVNPKYNEVLGLKCYHSVSEIPGKADLAVIMVPPDLVPRAIEDLGKKKTEFVVVISSGFGEVGNEKLKDALMAACKKYSIKMVGPNGLGITCTKENLDTIFFPVHKLRRPGYGGISIVTQSGGVGTSLLAIASSMGIGINKFVSYGNSYILDESDFIKYMADDQETKAIVVYVEGVTDGRKFLDALVYANKKKPIIALKAGKETLVQSAVKSHTGAMAGNYLAYRAAFKKAKVMEAENMNDLFDYLSVSGLPLPKGNRVGIISNGGGFGVMATDSVLKNGLEVQPISDALRKQVSEFLPSYTTPNNPLDLVADADVERFKKAIDAFMGSDDFDMVCVSVLFQTPMINETLLNPLVRASSAWKKPMVLIVPGGDEVEAFKKITTINKVPTFDIPERAVGTLKKLYDYAKFRGTAKD
jgi:acetyl coenzyme A synthetase (ADP forming)-like protein